MRLFSQRVRTITKETIHGDLVAMSVPMNVPILFAPIRAAELADPAGGLYALGSFVQSHPHHSMQNNNPRRARNCKTSGVQTARMMP